MQGQLTLAHTIPYCQRSVLSGVLSATSRSAALPAIKERDFVQELVCLENLVNWDALETREKKFLALSK